MSEVLTVRSVEATLVLGPMRRPLGTGVMRITEAPLLLIDLQIEEGITGRTYLFCYLELAGRAAIALARDVSTVLAGTVASPAAFRRALEARFTTPTRPSISSARSGTNSSSTSPMIPSRSLIAREMVD
jgi:mandelate racemase/muconate lactonizing enzyme-like protein